MNNPNILIGYHNTLLYVAGSLIVGMTLTPLGAYALSCKGYPFRKAIVFLFVFTMYFSGGMVPNFLTISAYGMYNTAWAIILPTAVSTYNMIVMRTTFAAVPEALRESAYIDGANDPVILVRILLPLIKPQIELATMFTLLNGLKIYDSVVSLTGGGPSRQTVVLPMWIIENAFTYSNFGYASAMCIAFIIVVLIFNIVLRTVFRGENYEY